MVLFLTILRDRVSIRLPSPPEGPHVHCQFDVRPGESIPGYTYEELRSMGDGRHDLPDPPEASGPAAPQAG